MSLAVSFRSQPCVWNLSQNGRCTTIDRPIPKPRRIGNRGSLLILGGASATIRLLVLLSCVSFNPRVTAVGSFFMFILMTLLLFLLTLLLLFRQEFFFFVLNNYFLLLSN
jgi:hypothetical protein